MQALQEANEQYWDEAQIQYNNSFQAVTDLKDHVHVSFYFLAVCVTFKKMKIYNQFFFSREASS